MSHVFYWGAVFAGGDARVPTGSGLHRFFHLLGIDAYNNPVCMPNDIDIHENHILQLSGEVLERLLADRTTGRHITWATHDYEPLGDGYAYGDETHTQDIFDYIPP